jgi:hypothetical protein
MHVTELAAEGDDVIVRVVLEGTHTRTLDFKQPVPATNTWMAMDRLEMMSQLGVGPGMPPKSSP